MFELYFGKFLLNDNIITQDQYDFIIKELHKTHVKLGVIAVAENLLTHKQAETINDLQKQMDKRFGDIAVEKGYLVEEEVTHLLNMQQNSSSKMFQLLIDNNILTMDDLKTSLNNFQTNNNFTDDDLENLKSGDIDRIFSTFSNIDNNYINEIASLIIRNIVRFVNGNISIKKSYKTKNYEFEHIATQTLIGDRDILIGISGSGNNLLSIANPYSGETFTEVDEDTYDAIGEFINCSSGIFASKLSIENIELDMTPPLFYNDEELTSNKEIYVVPVIVDDNQIDLVFIIDNDFEIE